MIRCPAALFAVLTAMFLLNSVQAQDTKKPKLDIDIVFKKLDSNNDGKLVKDEFLRLADRFKDKEKAREKLTRTHNIIDPRNIGLTRDQFRRYLDGVKKKHETP